MRPQLPFSPAMQALAVLHSRVEDYAPQDAPGTEYVIWQDLPLALLTDDAGLRAEFGAGASFQFALCRNGLPVMLYKLDPADGSGKLLDDPRLLRGGLPALSGNKRDWPSLQAAVAAAETRGKGPNGPARQTGFCLIDPSGWPELAAKGVLQRPDSPDLTEFGRTFVRDGKLLRVFGPYRPGAPDGERWPEGVCCAASMLEVFFPPVPEPAQEKEPERPAERLPLDRRLQQLREGPTPQKTPEQLMRAVDRLMALPFRCFAPITGGCLPQQVSEGAKTEPLFRGYDMWIRDLAWGGEAREMTYLEAVRRLDALLTDREMGRWDGPQAGPSDPRLLLGAIAQMYELLYQIRSREGGR